METRVLLKNMKSASVQWSFFFLETWTCKTSCSELYVYKCGVQMCGTATPGPSIQLSCDRQTRWLLVHIARRELVYHCLVILVTSYLKVFLKLEWYFKKLSTAVLSFGLRYIFPRESILVWAAALLNGGIFMESCDSIPPLSPIWKGRHTSMNMELEIKNALL